MKQNLLLIHGGTKGIGLAIVKKFLKNNYIVISTGRSKIPLKRNKLFFFKMDIKKESHHKKLKKYLINKNFNNIDCIINCAGYSKWSPIEKVTIPFWNDMIDTNLKGTFLACKFGIKLLNKGGASIINISSLAGKRGSKNNSVYCASKFAVNGLTQALSKELGKVNIRVNAVCPVYVDTPLLSKALNSVNSPSKGKNKNKYLKKFTSDNSAMLRLPLANEVADTCLYLSSNKSSAITGQCINVDCGVLPS
jgi:NAD(P)-dependent dehydrogenase (short-subunit alcohol dehydrogenase family)